MTGAPEYWVVQVVLHKGPPPVQGNLATHAAIAADACIIADGFYLTLPDGCIAEPVEVFESYAQASGHRAHLALKLPGFDFRIVVKGEV